MKVLVTGHHGYIGAVLVPMLLAEGHEVTGLDADFFAANRFVGGVAAVPTLGVDLRDTSPADLNGFDAVIHLAALSNDPLGDLNPHITYDINYKGTIRLAQAAKRAGVARFLFSSSCSMYGAAGSSVLDETAAFNPVTPYAESKVLAERDLTALADECFSPVFLRNTTAYGVSPFMRLDIVLNNLVAAACTTAKVFVQSDGTPWRPLVHVSDIGRAFLACLDAPREAIHNQAFNVGITEENYQVRTLAEIVRVTVPGSAIQYAPAGGPDPRSYRVTFEKIKRRLPGFRPQWNIREGARELYRACKEAQLRQSDFEGPRFKRILQIRELLSSGALDSDLRWHRCAPAAAESSVNR